MRERERVWNVVITTGIRSGRDPVGMHSMPRPQLGPRCYSSGSVGAAERKILAASRPVKHESPADLQFDCHHYLILWAGELRLFSANPNRGRISHFAVVSLHPIRTSGGATRGQVVVSQAGKTAGVSLGETSQAFIQSDRGIGFGQKRHSRKGDVSAAIMVWFRAARVVDGFPSSRFCFLQLTLEREATVHWVSGLFKSVMPW